MRLSRRSVRGVGLFDGMIALAILSFGVLALTRLQTNLVREASETQSRTQAVQLADELLSTALVDVDNAPCYTVPAAGACASDEAKDRTAEWEARAREALPGTVAAGSVLAGDRLTVTLSWTGRASDETRTLEVTTDVRP